METTQTATYFTVILPYAGPFATQWHPTTPVGPFSTLSRGAFGTVQQACRWAAERIPGYLFRVKKVTYGVNHGGDTYETVGV